MYKGNIHYTTGNTEMPERQGVEKNQNQPEVVTEKKGTWKKKKGGPPLT